MKVSQQRQLIENEFCEFMQQVYPKVHTDSPQFKTSRLLFYAGAYILITHKKGQAQKRKENCNDMFAGIKSAMEFASDAAKKGIPAEIALTDLMEK